jgi:hypothetical protein
MSVSKFINALEKLLDESAKKLLAEQIKSESEGEEDDVEVLTPEPEDEETVSEQDGDVAGDNSQPAVDADADPAQLNEEEGEEDDTEFSIEMIDGEDEEEVLEAGFNFDELDEACADVEESDDLEIDVEPGQEVVDEEGDEEEISGADMEDDEEGNLGV